MYACLNVGSGVAKKTGKEKISKNRKKHGSPSIAEEASEKARRESEDEEKRKAKEASEKARKETEYEAKRKADVESATKVKAAEEGDIKKETLKAAIETTTELEAKVAEEHANKKANEEEPIKQAAEEPAIKKATKKDSDENVGETIDVNQTDNQEDIKETDDVEQVLKKISTMLFLNTSTRSKKKKLTKAKTSRVDDDFFLLESVPWNRFSRDLPITLYLDEDLTIWKYNMIVLDSGCVPI
ncbi:hypothetical protein Tco_1064725, partial [Tanacetum coccineum]